MLRRLLKQAEWPTLASVVIGGCGTYLDVPGDFRPLSDITSESVVRIYAAPIPVFAPIAVHTWTIVRSAESDTFDR